MTGSSHLAEGGPEPEDVQGAAILKSARGFRVGLKIRRDFQRAAKGRRCNASSLGLQAVLRPEGGSSAPRFGLTVTKRVGNAVERNRIKRRLRAVLREPSLAPQAGHDYVIVARREALSLPFAGLVADLTKTLNQVRGGRASKRQGRPDGTPSAKPDPSR